MKRITKIDGNYFLYFLIFACFLLVGILSFKDYGVSIDEHFHYSNGAHYYNFLKGLFFSNPNSVSIAEIKNSFQYQHFRDPAIYDLILAFLIDILKIDNLNEAYYLRHFFNFIIFLIGIFYFLLILRERFSSNLIITIGILLLFVSPRIFANSFYNNKDLIFLSISCVFFYYSIIFFFKPSLKSAIFLAIVSALAFDIRVLAIIFILSFYMMIFLNHLDNPKKSFEGTRYYPLITIFTLIFIYIFWPYLWIDPINNLINFFADMKTNMPGMQNLYLGNLFFSKNTPWHYEMIWIVITSPITVTLFFLIGYFFILKFFFINLLDADNKKHRFWYDKSQFINFYFFIVLTLSFILKVKFGVSYAGWRQIYYLYPLVIFFSLCGIEILIKKIKKSLIKNLLIIFISIEFIFLSFWNYKNHPFQYVFFNPLFNSFVKNKFDLDYWGMSNKFILNKILKINDNKPLKVTTISFTNLNDNHRILDQEKRNKIKIVYDVKQADFVIDNYMKKWSTTPGKEILNKEFMIVYNLTVDGNIINTIYKRK